MRAYHAAVLVLFCICGAERGVVVYGEYSGGWHPQVGPQGPGRKNPVQQHVAYPPMHYFYVKQRVVAELTSSLGCDPIARDGHGESALTAASASVNVIKWLLDARADAGARDQADKTPLWHLDYWAKKEGEPAKQLRYQAVVKLLISCGGSHEDT